MARNPAPIEISQAPELSRIVAEVRATRRPLVLSDHGEQVAMIVPLTQPDKRRRRPLALPKGSVIARTAGMLAGDIPALSAEQEREAFEQGVAEEVMEEMGS
jgi:antitoxin (DNA-binding transcriptional repressor) of toxin-antitoxin stability system